MFAHKKIQKLDDFFTELNSRQEKGVYFYRINGYSEEIGRFIRKFYEAARLSGIIIEGKLPNPDEKNLEYYEEIMGTAFQMNPAFIAQSLKKWLPGMNERQRQNVADSVYDTLDMLRKNGKNEDMLKNAYIKFMCWLYYKFGRIMNVLGENKLPKILYEGAVSNYELLLISILSKAGCDAVLLQYNGDAGYLKLDPGSGLSDRLELPGMAAFPEGFQLRQIRDELKKETDRERVYGTRPKVVNATNIWIDGKGLPDIRKSVSERGNDPKLFYNCFYRINGVEDKLTYVNELYQLLQELKNSGRRVVVIDEAVPRPVADEIMAVKRRSYTRQEEMLMDLSANIRYTANTELQRVMVKAFLDVLFMEAEQKDINLNRLTTKAVYLVCWIRRYQKELFSNWKMPEVGCFIHMGACRDKNEAMLLRFLARIPVDVLVLNPDRNVKCCLEDTLLYEISFEESLPLFSYPQQDSDVRLGTAAYHAERELDTLMYQDTGMYRNQQYAKANSVMLQTTYEEIKILWKEELKYRPNFSTENNVVTLPVIFAKVSGVKDGEVGPYWASVRELVTEDTLVVKTVPYIDSAAPNPMKELSAEFLKNGRIRRNKIKEHPSYPYGFLREEIQEHILDKMQLLIDERLIKGTFENGTEYTIVATLLNLPKEVVRLMQKFDFTKENPKLLYFNTGEKMISIEDTVLTAFLNLAGFDVVFFVPAGYQNIEKYFNKRLMEEHQIGEYVYDLQVPRLTSGTHSGNSLFGRIFRRVR